MGKFDYLTEKGKTIKIGEVDYIIKPLTANNLRLFSGNDKDQAGAMFDLVTKTLQTTDAEITLADVEGMPIKIFNEVAEAIMDVNDLK